jgi:hypothetical protein
MNQGRLPWDIPYPKLLEIDPKDPLGFKKKLQNERTHDKYLQTIKNIKLNIDVDQFCSQISPGVGYLLKYAQKLTFT